MKKATKLVSAILIAGVLGACTETENESKTKAVFVNIVAFYVVNNVFYNEINK